LSGRDLFPPVDGFAVGGHLVEEVGDELDVCSTAAGPAELPELAGSSVIVVDRLVDGVGVDLAGAVAVERGRNVFDELGQSRLVVGGYASRAARRSAFVPTAGRYRDQASWLPIKFRRSEGGLRTRGAAPGWVPRLGAGPDAAAQ
jgi:hypothetical protein